MQKRHVFGDMSLEIYNSDGELIKNLSPGKNKGINRVNWVVRKKPPKVKASSPLLAFRTAFGPTFPPGDYKIVIKKGENTYESTLTLRVDPQTGHSQEDMDLQFTTLNKAYDLLEDISFTDKQVTDLKEKLDEAISQMGDSDLKQKFTILSEKLETMHKELVATSPHRLSGERKLAEKIGDIYSGVINYSGRPTDSQIERLFLLEGLFLQYRKQVDLILNDELKKVNTELQIQGIEEIKVITREEYDAS